MEEGISDAVDRTKVGARRLSGRGCGSLWTVVRRTALCKMFTPVLIDYKGNEWLQNSYRKKEEIYCFEIEMLRI